MNYARLQESWRSEVLSTGLWADPPPWPPDDTSRLPFVSELDAALEALKRIYGPNEARKIFRSQPGIATLLTDLQFADKSALLALGLDLAAAAAKEPWKNGDLVAKLRVDEQFAGARFEVQLMAALSRGGVHWEFEPLRERGGVNPDFGINTGARDLIVDAKAARISAPIKAEEEWYQRLLFGDLPPTDPMVAEYDFVRSIADLSASDRRALREDVHASVRRLHNAQTFPATEVVRDIVRVTVTSPPRWVLKRTFDTKAEARRIVRGLVQQGAEQIPSGEEGAVIVNVGRYGDLADSMEELRRWMRQDDGVLYPQLECCFFVGQAFYKHNWVYWVIPVGRQRLESDVIDLANRLVRGLNHYATRLHGYVDDDLPLLDTNGDFVGAEQ